jgi:DNA-binding NarL/FixJ family response regulator
VSRSEPLRVVIADDHHPTRKMLRQTLERTGIVVCADARDASGAVAAVAEHRPDVVLLDIHMPGNGIEAAWEISEQAPETAVVMLTVSRDDEDLFGALQAGAVGYLLKGIDPDRLPTVLDGVLAGEVSLPRSLASRLVEEFRARGQRRYRPRSRNGSGERLTDREWEVLELLRAGASTAEIADQLFVSKVTVRTHVSAILRKLRVPDRAAAVRLMREPPGVE